MEKYEVVRARELLVIWKRPRVLYGEIVVI
jgi:hypothetical protein